jgi:hypothetical protein
MKMVIRLSCVLVILISVVSLSLAQNSDKGKRSEAVLKKARQLDLLNHLLPLTLTKPQINNLLGPIEKCRRKVKEIEDMEATDLIKFEARIDTAVAEGADKGKVPSIDFLKELSRLVNAFYVRRQIAAGENAEIVLAEIKKSWNKGQLTVAANSLNLKEYDPNYDSKTATEDYKLSFYIKDILLDPQAYEVLVRMSKRASD